MSEQLPYLLAFGGTSFFAIACIFFSIFAERFTSAWVNTLKTLVGCLGFLIVTTVFYEWNSISVNSLLSFFVSGFAGLGVGDLFLVMAFTRIGAARTLMVFGFSPLFTGIQGYLFFNQGISVDKLSAIICLMMCLFVFSYEGYKKNGSWEIKGVIFALLGVLLDAIGIGITRFGFEASVAVSSIEANFYRALGALCFFMIYNYFKPVKLITNLRVLTGKEKFTIITAGFAGTFLSLWMWNTAIKYGHLAIVSAIGVTGPFLATIFECIYYKKLPNRYMLVATAFFILGLYILLA